MNNLIFWIIVCSWVIPLGIRMYNRSRARRLQNNEYRGPGYPPQNLPGQGYQGQGYPDQNYPPQNYPGQNFPGQGFPTQDYQGYPSGPATSRPAGMDPQSGPSSNDPAQSNAPQPLPTGSSEPQGFRARRLAELDAKFTNGEIAMEDYMRQRGEIMRG